MAYVANQWENGEKLDLDKNINIEDGIVNVDGEKEDLDNKVFFIDEESTHTEYPSARAIWMTYLQAIGNKVFFTIKWYDEDRETFLYSNRGMYGDYPVYDNPNDSDTIQDFIKFDGGDIERIYRDMSYVKKPLPPESIKIITLPYKKTYLIGEYIDYEGTSAQALNKKNKPYIMLEDGMIPYKELIFPQVKVDGHGLEGRDESGRKIINVKQVGAYEETLKYMFAKAGLDANPKVEFNPKTYAEIYKKCDERGYCASFYIYVNDAGLEDIFIIIFDIVAGMSFYEDEPYYPYCRFQNRVAAYVPGELITIETNPITLLGAINDVEIKIATKLEVTDRVNTAQHGMLREYKMGNVNMSFNEPDIIPLYYATSELDCGTAMPIEFSTRGKAVAESVNGQHVEYWFEGARLALAYSGRKVYYLAAGVTATVLRITERVIDEETGQTVSEGSLPTTHAHGYASQGAKVYIQVGMIEAEEAIKSVTPHSTDNVAPFIAWMEATANDDAQMGGGTASNPDYDGDAYRQAGNMGWTIVYGNIDGSTTTYNVPVKWPRRGDGKVLETTMNLEVVVPTNK